MPVGQFPGDRGWGYDGVHPYAVQESYGGPRGLQRFIDAAHRTGLAVILELTFLAGRAKLGGQPVRALLAV